MNHVKLLGILAAVLMFPVAAGAEIQAGRVAGWAGGTADIMIFGHDGPVGRIQADGSVTFDLPTPPETGQTVARTFDRCRTSRLEVVNGEADVAPTMLYIEAGGEQLGLIGADSPEMAAYQLSWGQTELVKGSFLRWLHVDGDAAVTGRCAEEMVTVSGPVEFVVDNDLRLVSGWNLVRTAHLEVMRHADGSAHETHVRHDALQAWPADATWYVEAK